MIFAKSEANMLTQVQEGMIYSCLRHRVKMAYTYFSKKKTIASTFNAKDKVDDYISSIQRLPPIEDTEFDITQINQLTGIHRNNPLSRLSIELRGILTANFSILEKLGIINSIRDSETVVKDNFLEKADEIQRFSAEKLEKIVEEIFFCSNKPSCRTALEFKS